MCESSSQRILQLSNSHSSSSSSSGGGGKSSSSSSDGGSSNCYQQQQKQYAKPFTKSIKCVSVKVQSWLFIFFLYEMRVVWEGKTLG